MTNLGVLAFLPPARVSNEVDLLRNMPGVDVGIVSDRRGWGTAYEVTPPVLRVPWLGSSEAWTAAVAWYRHLDAEPLPEIDVVVSLELCSPTSLQASRVAHRLNV